MDEVIIVNRKDEESRNYFCYQALTQFQKDFDKDSFNKSFDIITSIITSILAQQEVITAVIEEGYVDRIYRDCYYNHFSGKHSEYSRYCKRVFLFTDDCSDGIKNNNERLLNKCFIGCFVIKPLKVGAVGRTLLNPKYLFGIKEQVNTYVRTAEYYVHLRGMRLKVNAFPFSMQDGETLTCAETSLLNIFDYYSNKYSDYKFILPSDIFNAAKSNGYERNLPSIGLSYMLVSRIMIEFGFYPRLYLKDAIRNDEELVRILSYYVESAIPVALGVQGKDYFNHSVVCIGHGRNNVKNLMKKLHRVSANDSIKDHTSDKKLFIADSANTIEEFIVMDDNKSPYSTYKVCNRKKDVLSNDEVTLNDAQILCLAVPLYKRMYLEAKDARSICIELLKESQFSFDEQYSKLFSKQIGTKSNPIVMRIFLASSRTFKRERILSFDQDDFGKCIYNITPFPQFVWVCELYDLKYYKKGRPIGEIVLDATSTATTKPFESVIMMNYPGKYLIKQHNGTIYEKIYSVIDLSGESIDLMDLDDSIIVTLDEKMDKFKMFVSNLKQISKL